MDILTLIKERRSTRKYQNISIPEHILEGIIQSGIWGPSLLTRGLQPWEFLVIKDRKMIKEIGKILLKKSKTIGIGPNIILSMSANVIDSAQVIVAVFNNSSLTKFAIKLQKKRYLFVAKMSEICAISAAIQNMVLTAESFGVGSCWLDAPLFCRKKINKLLKKDEELVAMLALGYPDQKGQRSPRKDIAETVRYIT
jgi:nitroreductase